MLLTCLQISAAQNQKNKILKNLINLLKGSFKALLSAFCPSCCHQYVPASVPPDRWTPPSSPDPSLSSVAQVFVCVASQSFLSVIRHALAGLLRRHVPARRGGPGLLARRTLGPTACRCQPGARESPSGLATGPPGPAPIQGQE